MSEKQSAAETRMMQELVTLGRNHPGVAFTALYGYFSLVGFVYGSVLLQEFGVGFVDYFELPDYIYIALKFPSAFNYSTLLVGLLVLSWLSARLFERLAARLSIPELPRVPALIIGFADWLATATRPLVPISVALAVIAPFVLASEGARAQAEAIRNISDQAEPELSAVGAVFHGLDQFMAGRTPLEPTGVSVTVLPSGPNDVPQKVKMRLVVANTSYFIFFNAETLDVVVLPRTRIAAISYEAVASSRDGREAAQIGAAPPPVQAPE